MQPSANKPDASFAWQAAIDRQPLSCAAGLYSTSLTCLSVCGQDAAKFLQGQISIDMPKLVYEQGVGGAHLATRLDLKGRVVAVFWVVAVADGYRLLLPSSMAATLLADLGKYIVFSKASIEPLPLTVVAVNGANIAAGAVRMLDDSAFIVGTSVGTSKDATAGNAPGAAGDNGGLALVAGSEAALEAFWQPLVTPSTDTLAEPSLGAWETALIDAGLVLTEPATAGLWLPQELGCDALGAVSFSKGCYLGQEVVARLHFKGKVKQHLYRLDLEADAAQPLPSLGAAVTTLEGKKIGRLAAVVAQPNGAESVSLISCLLILKEPHDTPLQIAGVTLNVTSCRVALEA